MEHWLKLRGKRKEATMKSEANRDKGRWDRAKKPSL